MVKVILLFSSQSVIFVAMKKIIKLYRRWRYRHLYRQLFMLYANKFDYAESAAFEASAAFKWMTGYYWDEWFNSQYPTARTEDASEG